MLKPLKILFVCARNQWRSPTAEQVYRNDPRVAARSAGVSRQSRHEVSAADLEWADWVLAMERRHLARLREIFPEHRGGPAMASLDIPDDYQLMDGELVELIRAGTEPFILSAHSVEGRSP